MENSEVMGKEGEGGDNEEDEEEDQDKKETKHKTHAQVAVQQVEQEYGNPNPKPSKFEKKMRHIFTQMKPCKKFALKNKGNEGIVLSQKGSHVAKAVQNEDGTETGS